MSGPPRKLPETLRSARWFAPDDLRTFGHRSRMMMLRGNYAGQTLGSSSDAWKYWDERRAGNISD